MTGRVNWMNVHNLVCGWKQCNTTFNGVRFLRAIRCPGLNANQLVVVLVVLVNIRREQSTRSVEIVLFWSPGALVAL